MPLEPTAEQRAALRLIGRRGALPNDPRLQARELSELERAGMIVFWTATGGRPFGIHAGTEPGRWYLTLAGAAVLGLEPPPLRLSSPAPRSDT